VADELEDKGYHLTWVRHETPPGDRVPKAGEAMEVSGSK
jgi:hypothetical protein